jgi:hypothetical protein
MDRVLMALAESGYLMTPDARERLADDGQGMDLDSLVDFVLTAEGLGDPCNVDRRARVAVREIIERELAR